MKTTVPLTKRNTASAFSINEFLNKKEDEKADPEDKKIEEKLPQNHFSETDLHDEWQIFITNLRNKDAVVYNAINGFVLKKLAENEVTVYYPSESAREEFNKIRGEFFNHFQHKMNHFNLKINYQRDEINLKREVVTKRTIFEKLAKINPILKDLDELMRFDFS